MMPLEVSDAVLSPPLMKQTKIYFEQNFQMAGKAMAENSALLVLACLKVGAGA